MVVSQLLYVGTGPDAATEQSLYRRDVVRVATALQARDVVNSKNVAVVPTRDVAREALILLGSTPEWARMAVFDAEPDWTDIMT